MTHSELSFTSLKAAQKLFKGSVIKPAHAILGQKTALEALNFGLNQNRPHTHIFCVGPKGVGRTTLTRQAVEQFAKKKTIDTDWVYVANFDCFSEPKLLSFKAGEGRKFAALMEKTTLELKKKVPGLYTGEKYQNQLKEIEEDFESQKQAFLDGLNTEFLKKKMTLVKTKQGLGISPIYQKTVLDAASFNTLPETERKKWVPKLKEAQKKLMQALKKAPNFDQLKRQAIENINLKLLSETIDVSFGAIQNKYPSDKKIISYLASAKQFLMKNFPAVCHPNASKMIWRQLLANPFICHAEKETIPVVQVDDLSLSALLGFVQRSPKAEEAYSPHLQIKSGALHQANGGVLILQAKALLEQTELWHLLKQALFLHQIKMASSSDGQTLYPLRSLAPEVIPLNVKVILIGQRSVYEDLKAKDEDFVGLFKVLAEFVETLPRTAQNEKMYLGALKDFEKKNHLLTFTKEAYEELMHYVGRLTTLGGLNLSLYLSQVHDVMYAADFEARQAHASQVFPKYIQLALHKQELREKVPQTLWLEDVKDGLVALSVKGKDIGRVNALSVRARAEQRFGRVGRLSCTTCAGQGLITDIEHQSTFGGPIHTKGMLVLSAYLSARYGKKEPLKLNASLTFEQSYGPVDGDSASSSELCALMSAIGQIPLSQEIALTGSVNQMGEIQAVGSINEKIEGFFEVCQTLGLTHKQGVIIPAVCVKELMLNEAVMQAIKAKKFHLYPVRHIDECMEILTGLNKKAVDEKISTAWHQAFLNSKN